MMGEVQKPHNFRLKNVKGLLASILTIERSADCQSRVCVRCNPKALGLIFWDRAREKPNGREKHLMHSVITLRKAVIVFVVCSVQWLVLLGCIPVLIITMRVKFFL
jgi:hypothetical protein